MERAAFRLLFFCLCRRVSISGVKYYTKLCYEQLTTCKRLVHSTLFWSSCACIYPLSSYLRIACSESWCIRWALLLLGLTEYHKHQYSVKWRLRWRVLQISLEHVHPCPCWQELKWICEVGSLLVAPRNAKCLDIIEIWYFWNWSCYLGL